MATFSEAVTVTESDELAEGTDAKGFVIKYVSDENNC